MKGSGSVESGELEWRDLYSPETNSFLSIKNKAESRPVPDKAALFALIKHSLTRYGRESNLGTEEAALSAFLENSCLQTASLLLVRRLESTVCSYLGYIDNFQQVYRVKAAGGVSGLTDSSLAQMGVFPISAQAYLGVHTEREEERRVCSEIIEFGRAGKRTGGRRQGVILVILCI